MKERDELSFFIEPHLFEKLKTSKYETKKIKASHLLTTTRLDIAFKILFLEMLDRNLDFHVNAYQEHIGALSLGKYIEPGDNKKKNIEDFLLSFRETFESIRRNGFDSRISWIPLSSNGSIANGSHRIASAILLDKYVDCVFIDTVDHIYNYDFFYKRKVSVGVLDSVVTKFIEYADNVYMAFVWPAAIGMDKELGEIIPNILCKKNIELSENGAKNFLSMVYHKEEWLGNVQNNFRGRHEKYIQCFETRGPVRVIPFQAKNIAEVVSVKSRIRKIFKKGKSSIHITDTREEAVRMANIVFNDNSLHFINYANLNEYCSFRGQMQRFEKFISKNKLNKNDVLLDSSIVLSAYGLREAVDTDFLYSGGRTIQNKLLEILPHDESIRFYKKGKDELIYNPKNYFYFDNFKFVSFDLLYKMKKNRGELKDKNDCKIMESVIENNWLKLHFNKFNQQIYYSGLKIRAYLIKGLNFFGMYKFVRGVYKLLNK